MIDIQGLFSYIEGVKHVVYDFVGSEYHYWNYLLYIIFCVLKHIEGYLIWSIL